MQEVIFNLHVGNCEDYENIKNKDEWFFVAACKEPYHRQALGYKTRGAPKDHPEYLYCVRDNMLILNLVDADSPKWISDDIIEAALNIIEESLMSGKKVLVFCNQGKSRSATIAMLFMHQLNLFESGSTFEMAEQEFKERYPKYDPANGMRGYAKKKWSEWA